MGELLYQGHASFRLKSDNGIVLYLDPYAGDGYDLPADVIMVTHGHHDHSAVERCARKETCILRTYRDMLKDGEYQTVVVSDVRICAFPAYNANHPRESTVGFTIQTGGSRFYFAGDTSKIPEMALLRDEHLDYAFLPCDGYYNMGPVEAAECASIIGAVHSVPIHTCRNVDGVYREETAQQFDAPGRLLLYPSEKIIF